MAATQSKERILAGAKELFLARGYAATTVDAICEKAELTKGSFYYFFDSKEDLARSARMPTFQPGKHFARTKCKRARDWQPTVTMSSRTPMMQPSRPERRPCLSKGNFGNPLNGRTYRRDLARKTCAGAGPRFV
jgi:AcrR family transcriptional regulator